MKKHALAVLGAGCLWGFMGFFRRMLGASGLSSAGVFFHWSKMRRILGSPLATVRASALA